MPTGSDEQSGTPRVFVSYAHESRAHKNWVKSLATDMRTGGVDALLDEWRVGLGSDFTLFMDEIRTCDRVLLVCTPAYARKSNEGEGGVGYERSVITAELAKSIATSKFVCVLRASSAEDAIPVFVQSRRYIDFRDDSEYEVRLEELLRDLHNAPADPEPPVGKDPFAEERQAGSTASEPAFASDETSDVNPAEVARKSVRILSRGDMLGWKRLVRRVRRNMSPGLKAWRHEVGDKGVSEEKWPIVFDKGVEVCEPLLVLALTAVDSEIESVRDQFSLIDDLTGLEDWSVSGVTAVAYMPQALAFVYHHVLGAFFIESKMRGKAIELLTRTVRDPSNNAVSQLWQNHRLMGYPESLRGNCVSGWNYISGFYGAKPWMEEFFQSERAFTDSLRAYVMTASLVELSSFLARGATNETLKQELWLDVPPVFMLPAGERPALLLEVVSKAVPDRSALEEIAKAGGATVAQIREAWPAWTQQWLRSLGPQFRFLAHQFAGHAEEPVELPG